MLERPRMRMVARVVLVARLRLDLMSQHSVAVPGAVVTLFLVLPEALALVSYRLVLLIVAAIHRRARVKREVVVVHFQRMAR